MRFLASGYGFQQKVYENYYFSFIYFRDYYKNTSRYPSQPGIDLLFNKALY